MRVTTLFLVTDPRSTDSEIGDFAAQVSLKNLVNIANGTPGGVRNFLREQPALYTEKSEALADAKARFQKKFKTPPHRGSVADLTASSKETPMRMQSVDSTADVLAKYKAEAEGGNPATTEHEKEWQDYMKRQMKEHGIDSLDDLDEQGKKDFFNEIEKEWNAKDEAGPDGEISAVAAKYAKDLGKKRTAASASSLLGEALDACYKLLEEFDLDEESQIALESAIGSLEAVAVD